MIKIEKKYSMEENWNYLYIKFDPHPNDESKYSFNMAILIDKDHCENQLLNLIETGMNSILFKLIDEGRITINDKD